MKNTKKKEGKIHFLAASRLKYASSPTHPLDWKTTTSILSIKTHLQSRLFLFHVHYTCNSSYTIYMYQLPYYSRVVSICAYTKLNYLQATLTCTCTCTLYTCVHTIQDVLGVCKCAYLTGPDYPVNCPTQPTHTCR